MHHRTSGVALRARRLVSAPSDGHPAERFLGDVEGHTRRIRALFRRLTAQARG